MGILREIAPMWLPQNLINAKSTLVRVITWCRQAASHYPGQIYVAIWRHQATMFYISISIARVLPMLINISMHKRKPGVMSVYYMTIITKILDIFWSMGIPISLSPNINLVVAEETIWQSVGCSPRIHPSHSWHYNEVMMNATASQITSLAIVYSSVY